jgi:hypothetical protein
MLINAYATHRDPPAIEFPHQLRGRRDRSDPELGKHLNGFMGFVMDRGKRPMTAIRYGVLRHLERVCHHVSLEVEPSHMPAFETWARAANAIVFMPDGTVRAPDGRVLVAPDTGDPAAGAELPFPADAVARKAASEAVLAERGIRVPSTLPPTISEIEVELRPASEVASRVLALFACAARAESLAANEPLAPADMEKRLPLAFAAMTPKETAFMNAVAPAKQSVVDHLWRYEAIVPLAWSLGAFELPFPAKICDVPALAKMIFGLDAHAFLAAARLRETREILDVLDLVFRLHWATTDARANQREPVAGVEPGAVAERHHALNWLTRFEDAAWDDVTTPT